MPKTKISEYSVTNSSNTDIEGINIDEGCAPSGINNAIRELMVHLKEFQTGASGDAFTFAGGVLISGTANTITGNVLMSGTNTITGSTTATFAAGAVGTPSIAAHGDTNTGIFFPAADTIAFSEGGAEAMRIDSSGRVGIGTSSPSYPLSVSRAVNGGVAILDLDNVDDGNYGGLRVHLGKTDREARLEATYGSSFFTFYTDGAERARITAGGYFKASNSGSYISTTSTYHECYQTADSITLYCTGYNNSYTNAVIATQVQRSANAAYSFFDGYSGLSDLEFRLYGDGNGKCDGAWTGGGADYAEYFESANGQALTLGATVVLDGNKVREATDQDPASAIIGVVRPKEPSKASAMIGNAAWNKWAKKYLTDDFDRYIMEDHDVVEWEETITDEEGKTSTKQHSYESHNIPAGVTVPADAVRKTHDDKGNKFQHYKLNPAWDKDAEYVNRENRPEWNIIGLLGQVKILKGQPVGDRWIKMRDVSATVEEWMIR